MVGCYLSGSILGIAGGARPATLGRTFIRLGALVPYAIASGLSGALIAGTILGALPGHRAYRTELPVLADLLAGIETPVQILSGRDGPVVLGGVLVVHPFVQRAPQLQRTAVPPVPTTRLRNRCGCREAVTARKEAVERHNALEAPNYAASVERAALRSRQQ
ncbi:hypothetical protein [Streptomyces sp. NPDC002205]|uniref:hypothetical protein n=1 Tax=Streptomyces sp. NPDC002205 TaxID=3154411 RepID=UPI003332890D